MVYTISEFLHPEDHDACFSKDEIRPLAFQQLVHDDVVQRETQGELRLAYNTQNKVLRIQLCHPKSLNATSLLQLKFLAKLFANFNYSLVSAIVFTGTGGKAFCVGADLKQVTSHLPKSGIEIVGYHYDLSYHISTLKIPCISVWEGLVMGGGVGLLLYGQYRVATDTTQFSMPETAIGLFPDVGASFFYSRLPDGLGLYLDLTGRFLNGADVVNLGFATHFVPSIVLPVFVKAILTSTGSLTGSTLTLDRLFGNFHCSPTIVPSITTTTLTQIKKYFSSASSLNDVIARLEMGIAKNDVFARETYDLLRLRCPLSCGLWFSRHTYAANQGVSLRQALRMDFYLALSLFTRDRFGNFVEGVQALLIRKDRRPQWTPPSINTLTEDDVKYHIRWANLQLKKREA